MEQSYVSVGGLQVAVECSRGTRIIVTFTAAELRAWEDDEAAGQSWSWSRRHAHAAAVGALRRHVDTWAAGKPCPCCGGCLTLAELASRPEPNAGVGEVGE